jgi:hypothetical protein
MYICKYGQFIEIILPSLLTFHERRAIQRRLRMICRCHRAKEMVSRGIQFQLESNLEQSRDQACTLRLTRDWPMYAVKSNETSKPIQKHFF